MVDQNLIDKLKGWRDNRPDPDSVDEAFGLEFLTTLFTIFKQLSEEDEDLKEEVEDADICMQFIMTWEGKEFKFWISARDEKIDFGAGEGPDVTVTMIADAEKMFNILSGEVDSTQAYMAGDLKIEGNLQDAMAFGEIAGIAAELIEELMG
ncbi:MAG: SCP2 sterol-binding domain-containing protein [Promethearchaeota archaeon]